MARLAEHGSGLALIAPMLIDDLHALSDGLPHPPDPGMLRETAREVVANDYLVSTTMPDSYAAVEEISNAK